MDGKSPTYEKILSGRYVALHQLCPSSSSPYYLSIILILLPSHLQAYTADTDLPDVFILVSGRRAEGDGSAQADVGR
jgi:hypothetical protein